MTKTHFKKMVKDEIDDLVAMLMIQVTERLYNDPKFLELKKEVLAIKDEPVENRGYNDTFCKALLKCFTKKLLKDKAIFRIYGSDKKITAKINKILNDK